MNIDEITSCRRIGLSPAKHKQQGEDQHDSYSYRFPLYVLEEFSHYDLRYFLPNDPIEFISPANSDERISSIPIKIRIKITLTISGMNSDNAIATITARIYFIMSFILLFLLQGCAVAFQLSIV